MAQAKQAAGGKCVLLIGAGVTQLAIAADVVDELEISVIRVLLGQGRRRFEGLGADHTELERTRPLECDNGVTHLHCCVGH